MINEYTNNYKSKSKHQPRKPFITLFPKKNDTADLDTPTVASQRKSLKQFGTSSSLLNKTLIVCCCWVFLQINVILSAHVQGGSERLGSVFSVRVIPHVDVAGSIMLLGSCQRNGEWRRQRCYILQCLCLHTRLEHLIEISLPSSSLLIKLLFESEHLQQNKKEENEMMACHKTWSLMYSTLGRRQYYSLYYNTCSSRHLTLWRWAFSLVSSACSAWSWLSLRRSVSRSNSWWWRAVTSRRRCAWECSSWESWAWRQVTWVYINEHGV